MVTRGRPEWIAVMVALSCGSACAGNRDPVEEIHADVPPGAVDHDPAPPDDDEPDAAASSECKALWAVADDLGCALAKLVCAVVAAIPVGPSLVKCDVAVPLACGIASATADAAAALCPR